MGCPASCELETTLVFSIATHDPDTGNLTDADTAPTYRVYEEETAVAILSGTMAKLDDGNTTGFYTESITVSAANGFEKNKTYTIYIEATVDGDTGGITFAFKATDPLVTTENMGALFDELTADHNKPNTIGKEINDTYTKVNSIGVLVTAMSATVSYMAPILIGTVTGAGTGTEVYVYNGVTVTVTVTDLGNVTQVLIT